MIKITGKDYEAYVNKNEMINMYYDKKKKNHIFKNKIKFK